MATDHNYRPDVHVTAGWLRAVGIAIPRHVPDGAWVRASAVTFGPLVIDNPNDNPGAFSAHINVEIAEPFRWKKT